MTSRHKYPDRQRTLPTVPPAPRSRWITWKAALSGFAAMALIIVLAFAARAERGATPPVPGYDATVQLQVEVEGYGKIVCSGAHIGAGTILTAAHCIPPDQYADSTTYSIVTADGRHYRVMVRWLDRAHDIALVYATEELETGRPFMGSEMPMTRVVCHDQPVGTRVTVVGNPLGLSFIVTWGRVASRVIRDVGPWAEVIVIDVTSGPGNSGGPVFDEMGQLIGVMVGGTVGAPFALAVPGSTVCRLLTSAVS